MSEKPRERRFDGASLVAIFPAVRVALAPAVPATAAVMVGTRNIKRGAVSAPKIKHRGVNSKKIKPQAGKLRHLAPKTINSLNEEIGTAFYAKTETI